MNDEILDVINEENIVVGKEKKSVIHEKGIRHRVSAVLVKNENGKYLIPTASSMKAEAGKLFHSAAGHVLSDESYLKAAVRELKEECGLTILERNLEYKGWFWVYRDYPGRIESERFEVFEVSVNENSDKITMNREQLNEEWMSLGELNKIYLTDTNMLSFPLYLSCKYILNL